jgi:hypothetical protein
MRDFCPFRGSSRDGGFVGSILAHQDSSGRGLLLPGRGALAALQFGPGFRKRILPWTLRQRSAKGRKTGGRVTAPPGIRLLPRSGLVLRRALSAPYGHVLRAAIRLGGPMIRPWLSSNEMLALHICLVAPFATVFSWESHARGRPLYLSLQPFSREGFARAEGPQFQADRKKGLPRPRMRRIASRGTGIALVLPILSAIDPSAGRRKRPRESVGERLALQAELGGPGER